VAGYVRGTGLPYIVTGDFNAEIDELLPLGLHTYLGGEWRTPRGEVPGDHRAIDLVLVSQTLSTSIGIEWDQEGPWAAPHSGFTVTLDKETARMHTRVMVSPITYVPAMGPDLPWSWHLQQVQPTVQQGARQLQEHWKPHLAHDTEVDINYMTFMGAAECVWAQRQCQDYNGLKHHRGWPTETRELPLVAATPTGWRLRPSPLTAWHSLRARLANLIGAIRRKRSSIPDMRVAMMKQLTKVQVQARVLPEPQLELDVLASIDAMSTAEEAVPRNKPS
jgi:hypothetical protein